MAWATVHASHAIERTRLELAFSESLPRKTIELARRDFERNREALGFDRTQDTQVHNVVIGEPTHQPAVMKFSGWQAFRQLRPNQVREAIVINNDSLFYESTHYVQWGDALHRFLEVARDMITRFSNVVDVKAFGHDYTDRFIYKGAPQSAAPEGLISPKIIELLAPSARSGSELWHLHRGWFEVDKAGRFLINQNIDAQDGAMDSGEPIRSIQVYTRAEKRFEGNDFGGGELENMAGILHRKCNECFAKALSEHGRKMVSIGEDGHGTN